MLSEFIGDDCLCLQLVMNYVKKYLVNSSKLSTISSLRAPNQFLVTPFKVKRNAQHATCLRYLWSTIWALKFSSWLTRSYDPSYSSTCCTVNFGKRDTIIILLLYVSMFSGVFAPLWMTLQYVLSILLTCLASFVINHTSCSCLPHSH